MILTIRTDTPTAEIGLFGADGAKAAYHTWHAHRALAKDLLKTIQDQLAQKDVDFTIIKGIVVFQGPGSFTGLRIGITVANTIAYAQEIPIVGTEGEEWIVTGIGALADGQNDRIVLPEYGAEANITTAKK